LKDIYGVYPIRDLKKEKVKIRVSELTTHYLLAYPLHESQKITKESHGSSFITFELIPSDELAKYFLSQGKDIEILQPVWFKKHTL
jgi:predicted DNA-binding transcriptional regulator YafY